MFVVMCCQMCGRSVEDERPARIEITSAVPEPHTDSWTVCNACAEQVAAGARKAARHEPMQLRFAGQSYSK